MSRARKISSDLRHVATLAGTTAAVVEGAAIVAEKARGVTDGLGGEAEIVVVADEVTSAGRCCGRRRSLVVLLLVAILAAVGIAIWKKRSAQLEDDVTDLRDGDRFAGSMP